MATGRDYGTSIGSTWLLVMLLILMLLRPITHSIFIVIVHLKVIEVSDHLIDHCLLLALHLRHLSLQGVLLLHERLQVP